MNNEKNIEIIVNLLKQHTINRVVISPGGTNALLVKAFQEDEFFECYSVVDERSAIYFAIGLYLQTGKPVVTSCTSAQATRNYIPGLTEAFYKRVPILAITMSKHPRFSYQEYMQAPIQTSLPEDSIKRSFELPTINDLNDVLHSIRVVNESIIEMTRGVYGPVQLCVPWLDFPLGEFIPKLKKIENYYYDTKEWKFSLENKKVLIIIGEHRPFSTAVKLAIDKFCEKANVAIYTNHLSNFNNPFSFNGNLLVSSMDLKVFKKDYCPDILITIGGQTGDYPIYKMLSNPDLETIEHWRVSKDDKVIDTYDKMTKNFVCSELTFFNNLSTGPNIDDKSYFEVWKEKEKNMNRSVSLPFSNASIAQYLHDKIPQNSVIQFSILNSLRVWELFDIHKSINCFSNVGAFGIDGGLSTLIGQSVVTDELCFMIIGDLAFFYDMNSIGIRHIKNNLRILLINNNGGIEFKLNGEKPEFVNDFIAASNHFKSAKGWANDAGFDYLEAYDSLEFESKHNIFINESNKPILFEVFVSDINEAIAYKKLIDTNRIQTTSEKIGSKIKDPIKNIVGVKNIEKIMSKLK